MRKCNIFSLAAILMLLTFERGTAQTITLLKTTQFNHFPSASALQFYNNQLYVFGDDAKYALILDSTQAIRDSVLLFPSKEYRINKDEKADLEAATIVRYKDQPYLLAVPSFSTKKRSSVVAFPLSASKKHSIYKVSQAINLIKAAGVKEVNIEGAATVNQSVVLSNRANNTNKDNILLVINQENKNWSRVPPHSIIIRLPRQKNVIGISDLAYLPQKDLLLFTASSEATANATSDGAIGESFIGYINNISQKLGQKEITPDQLMNLSKPLKMDKVKIEAVIIEQYKNDELLLHLAADNDDGRSSLFKIKMTLK